jgi:hypothetical protein
LLNFIATLIENLYENEIAEKRITIDDAPIIQPTSMMLFSFTTSAAHQFRLSDMQLSCINFKHKVGRYSKKIVI